MIVRSGTWCRRAGFTLVELLTVIGIIALLLGILIPSLSSARTSAKKTKSRATIKAIETALEVVNVDFGNYPSSALGQDPIDYDLPVAPPDNGLGLNAAPTRTLSGAHWLARTMIGYDGQGIVADGSTLSRGDPFDGSFTPYISETYLRKGNPGIGASPPGRRGLYLDDAVFAQDSDTTLFGSRPGYTPTGRPVMLDAFDQPILYYRAHPRAQFPFSLDGRATDADSAAPQGQLGDQRGVYNHQDNALITGRMVDNILGWDFKGVPFNPVHRMAVFGSLLSEGSGSTPGVEDLPGSFTYQLHAHATHEVGNVVAPKKPETFILISSGADGRFGTEDDVMNAD